MSPRALVGDAMVFGFVPSDFVPFFPPRGVEEPTHFAVAMLFVTSIVLSSMLFILARNAPSLIRPTRILSAVALGAVIALVAVPVLAVVVDLNVFGFVQLAWSCLVFAVAPAAALVLLRGTWRRRLTPGSIFAAATGMLIWPLAMDARFIEPYRLQVERVTLEIEPDSRTIPPIRIGILADLQTDRITPYERHVVDRLMAEKPDLILIPGDLFQGSRRDFEAELPAFNALLRRLKAPLGVFFVTGDVDPPVFLGPLLDGTSIRPIDNRVVRFESRGIPIELAGLARSTAPDGAPQRIVDEWLEGSDAKALRIAMAHHPDAIDHFPKGSPLDLFVAGHTHGGQIVLPLLGPPVTLSSVPRRVGAGGLHRLQGHAIYVSRGAGMERGQAPRVRFFCPPEVTVIDLGSKRPHAG